MTFCPGGPLLLVRQHFSVGRAVRAVPALARHGQSKARLRLAFRISREDALRSVATSVSQMQLESTADNTHPDYVAST